MSKEKVSPLIQKEFDDALVRILKEVGAPNSEEIMNCTSFTESEIRLIALAEARFVVETSPGYIPESEDPVHFEKLKEELLDGLKEIYTRRGVVITP